MTARESNTRDADRPATLKMLADYLDLSPATVSIVLNNSPVAKVHPRRDPAARSRRRQEI